MEEVGFFEIFKFEVCNLAIADKLPVWPQEGHS